MNKSNCVLKTIVFAVLIMVNGMVHAQDLGYSEGNRSVTIWLVVINYPEACASMPCSEDDVFGSVPANPTKATVCYLTGQVVRPNGRAVFAGQLAAGSNHGCFFPEDMNPYNLSDAARAEVHIVVQEHGEPLPGGAGLEEQVTQFMGGCNPDCMDPQFATHVAADSVEGVSTSPLQRFSDESEISRSKSTLTRGKFGITVVVNTRLDAVAP
jgi:hypothetical protein